MWTGKQKWTPSDTLTIQPSLSVPYYANSKQYDIVYCWGRSSREDWGSTYDNGFGQGYWSGMGLLGTEYGLTFPGGCIDSGNNAAYLSGYPTQDLYGNNRVYNNHIDMGAIEYQGH